MPASFPPLSATIGLPDGCEESWLFGSSVTSSGPQSSAGGTFGLPEVSNPVCSAFSLTGRHIASSRSGEKRQTELSISAQVNRRPGIVVVERGRPFRLRTAPVTVAVDKNFGHTPRTLNMLVCISYEVRRGNSLSSKCLQHARLASILLAPESGMTAHV